MRAILFAILAAMLSGCVSTADIDIAKYEPSCARQCSMNHSQCISSPLAGPTLFAQCKEALQLCLQTCPLRQ